MPNKEIADKIHALADNLANAKTQEEAAKISEDLQKAINEAKTNVSILTRKKFPMGHGVLACCMPAPFNPGEIFEKGNED